MFVHCWISFLVATQAFQMPVIDTHSESPWKVFDARVFVLTCDWLKQEQTAFVNGERQPIRWRVLIEQAESNWLLPLSSYFWHLGQDQAIKMENLNKKAEINTIYYLKSNVWEYSGFTVSIDDNNVRRVSNNLLIYKSINVSCIVLWDMMHHSSFRYFSVISLPG